MYLILFFIKLLSFPPISGSDNSDCIFTVREAYRQYAIPDTANAKKAVFIGTVDRIFRNNTLRVRKSVSSKAKPDVMFLLIAPILFVAPFKSSHGVNIPFSRTEKQYNNMGRYPYAPTS